MRINRARVRISAAIEVIERSCEQSKKIVNVNFIGVAKCVVNAVSEESKNIFVVERRRNSGHVFCLLFYDEKNGTKCLSKEILLLVFFPKKMKKKEEEEEIDQISI